MAEYDANPDDKFVAGYLPGVTRVRINRDKHSEMDGSVVNATDDTAAYPRTCKVMLDYYNIEAQVSVDQIVRAEGLTSTTSVTSSSTTKTSTSSSSTSSTSSSTSL